MESIAQKLDKVCVLTLPDAHLINEPKTLDPKIKIQLFPSNKNKFSYMRSLSSTRNSNSYKKRKDPKFIPYEPYKGCVKPIFKKNNKKPCSKNKMTKNKCESSKPSKENNDDSAKLWSRLQDTIAEFEKEKATWEEERKKSDLYTKSLQEDLVKSKNYCDSLEQQLATQSQVNGELKKLLVASVGEDVQSRVQCLTEDKARMSNMIRKYSEKVDRDYEEREKMGIQCDVWHSKFLGASLLLDELAKTKALLYRQLGDSEEAITVLLDERNICQKHVLKTYKLVQQVRDAFDPLCTDGSHTLTSADLITTAVTAVDQSEWLRDRLLGNLGRSVGCSDSKYDNLETLTPGEKIASQVLDNIKMYKEKEQHDISVTSIRSPLIHRYNPNTRFDQVTVNCCGHCNGDIKVI